MPIHKYSAFRKFAKVSNVVNTSKIYNEILALPLYPTISKKHQDAVIKVIKSVKNQSSDSEIIFAVIADCLCASITFA